MKKKTNSISTSDTVSKLSDDKRKKITNPNSKILQTKNKSITDFISVDKNFIPANSNKTSNKTKKISQNHQHLKKELARDKKKEKEMMTSKFDEKTIFNEEVIDKIHLFFSPYIENLKASLEKVTYKQFHSLYLNFEEINKFFNQNMNNFLVKFFLQIDKRFLYIPRTFHDQNFFEKEKIVLFDGFDETKFLSLKYDPIKYSEIINQDIASKLKSYLKRYEKESNKGDKGFLLYDKRDDYFQNIKIIEALCNDYHYKIIKIDELEKEKNRKLNKISEACQSQRIFTLKDSINDKTKLLQNVLSQNETDSNSNYIDLIENQENSNNINASLNTNSNVDNITANLTAQPSNDSSSNKVVNIKSIVENIRSIGSSQKNLILFIDNFLNFEEDRSFYNSLTKLVSNSKTPVAFITNSLDKIPNEEHLLLFKYFSIFQKENEDKKMIILNVAIIVLLEVVFKKDLLDFIKDKNINEFMILIEILEIREKYYMEKLNKDYFDEFVSFIVEFCYVNEFSFDRICYSLKSLERFCSDFYQSLSFFPRLINYSRLNTYSFKSHDNIIAKFLNQNHLEVSSELINTHISHNYNEVGKNGDIKPEDEYSISYFSKILDDLSYNDELERCINRVKRREFKLSEKEYFMKYKTYTSAKNCKIQEIRIQEPIDCEDSRFDNLFQREIELFSKIKTHQEYEIIGFEKIVEIVRKEKELTIRRALPSFLRNKSSYETINFFNYLINLDNENFDKFLMKRQTRSYARRLLKNCNQDLDMNGKINAMLRFFIKRNISMKQMKGLLNTYNFDDLFTKINGIYYLSNTNLNFFTDFKLNDEINDQSSSSSDYEHKRKRKKVKI